MGEQEEVSFTASKGASRPLFPGSKHPLAGPAGASAQKVTVLNSGDDNQLNDFCPSAAFLLIFKGFSVPARKTDVCLAVTKQGFSVIKTWQKTHPKIKVQKTGVAASFLTPCLFALYF